MSKRLERRDFLSLAALASLLALPACRRVVLQPTPTGTEREETFTDPQIVGFALALGGSELPEVGKKLVYANGIKGKWAGNIDVFLPDSTLYFSSDTWYQIKGARIFQPNSGNFTVYYNPEQNLWLKAAPTPGLDRALIRGREATLASLRLAQVPEETIAQVRGVEVVIAGRKYSATLLPHLGETLDFRMVAQRQLTPEFLKEMSQLYRRAFAHAFRLFETRGIYKADANLGNFIVDSKGRVFAIDWERDMKQLFNDKTVAYLFGRFKKIAARRNISLGAKNAIELMTQIDGITPTIPVYEGPLELMPVPESGSPITHVLADGTDDAAKLVSGMTSEAVIVEPPVQKGGRVRRLISWVSDQRNAVWNGVIGLADAAFLLWGASLIHEAFDPVSRNTLDFYTSGENQELSVAGGNNMDDIWDYLAEAKKAQIENDLRLRPTIYGPSRQRNSDNARHGDRYYSGRIFT